MSLGLLALAVRPGLALPAGRLMLWLRLAITVAALGYAFLLDDSSEPTTEAVAGSLLLRRALRVALLLPATAAWWVVVVWRVRAVHPGLPLPVAALTLEAAALLAVTVALAAAGSHLAPERRGGVVAAPALLALASAAFLLPAQVALYAQPGSAAWEPPTGAGPCCSASPWGRSPPPAATRPTGASPAASANSLTGSPADAPPGRKPGAQGHLTPLVGWNGRPVDRESGIRSAGAMTVRCSQLSLVPYLFGVQPLARGG